MTHTPTPWAVGPYGGVYRLNDDGIHGPLIVSGETKNGTLPNKEENEAFIVAAVNAYDKQRALIETLTAALDECEDYFDNRADADCDQDGYIPNEEMKRLTTVRDALDAAKKEGFL